MRVGARTIEITHPERMLFPGDGITKGDLAEYYRLVGPAMLPHVADRPLNLERFPNGIDEGGFFQQEMPEYYPGWITGVMVGKAGGELRHVVAEEPATLVYLANQNCITPHAWLSRQDRLDQPDQMIFDLDPPEANDPRVRHATLRLGALLAELGLPAFVKTTGSRGYHVLVPLDRDRDFDAVRDFANAVAELLAQAHGEHLTTEQRKRERRGRILVDTLRNAYAHTAVPPYAVRARPGAPVATPITWEELADPAMHPQRFTLRDVPERLERLEQRDDDPWRDLARRAVTLDGAQERLDVIAAEAGAPRRRVPRTTPSGEGPSANSKWSYGRNRKIR